MKSTKLTENTYVSIGLIGVVAGGVITGVIFVASLGFSSSLHGKEIEAIKAVIKERREARATYETNVALQISYLKADISIVDTRITHLTDMVERAIEQRAVGAHKKGR